MFGRPGTNNHPKPNSPSILNLSQFDPFLRYPTQSYLDSRIDAMEGAGRFKLELGLGLYIDRGPAPQGQQNSAQGFNPGNPHNKRFALKGREMRVPDEARICCRAKVRVRN